MGDSSVLESLSRCRAEARRLLKHLRESDPVRARTAATRFLRLRSFRAQGVERLLAGRSRVRLKHALSVLADEHGFPSWPALKRALEARGPVCGTGLPGFHVPRHHSLLNRWFTDHGEACTSLAEHGGYLLPFRDQYFVTESEGVRELGLAPDDPDWAAIGFDMVRPRDPPAHARLCARRRAAIERGIGVPTEQENP